MRSWPPHMIARVVMNPDGTVLSGSTPVGIESTSRVGVGDYRVILKYQTSLENVFNWTVIVIPAIAPAFPDINCSNTHVTNAFSGPPWEFGWTVYDSGSAPTDAQSKFLIVQ